jgi:drug/metabolite transporter (DMT)-like permease
LLATLILGTILLYKKSIHQHHIKKIWRYFVLGAIYSIYFVFMFVALKFTTTVSIAAIFTLLPLFCCYFGTIIPKEIFSIIDLVCFDCKWLWGCLDYI